MIKHPAGDVLALLDWTYEVPTTRVTVKDGVATSEETTMQVEMWLNPQTGEEEPFVAVYLDKNGRLPLINAKLTMTEEIPSRPFPDWGGQLGDLKLDLDVQNPTAWVAAGLITTGLLWLILFLLRGR